MGIARIPSSTHWESWWDPRTATGIPTATSEEFLLQHPKSASIREGLGPICEYECPTEALAYGDDDDPESAFSKSKQRCLDRKYHIFELPEYEGSRSGVVYATKM